MNPRRYRTTVRWVHLGLSGVLGTYVYSPWSALPVFDGLVKWIAFPLLAITGAALWKQATVLKRLGFSPGSYESTAARNAS